MAKKAGEKTYLTCTKVSEGIVKKAKQLARILGWVYV